MRAAAEPLAEPDPIGDVFVAMNHTDILLQAGAPAEEVAAAGEPALAAAAALHLDSQLISTTRSNVAEAWLHAGDVERAARTIGHTTDGAFRHEDWALHLLRAEVEIAQGRLEDALARVDLVGRQTFSAAMVNAIDFRQDTNAILVGEPIGERPNSYSENDEITLPRSRLVVSYSTRYYQFLDQDVPAVEPDQRVDPSWEAYKAGRDPVMDWVLSDSSR